jgi:hypothetical protein
MSDSKRREALYEIVSTCFYSYNRELKTRLFEIWYQALEEWTVNEIAESITNAMKTCKFLPTIAEVIALLPDHSGHPPPEVAWQICPKTEFDGDWVTDQIMQARSCCEADIECNAVSARMAFLEAYRKIMTQYTGSGKKAVWWYSGPSEGTHENRAYLKLRKTLEAYGCGKIPAQLAEKSVKNTCKSLEISSTQYLSQIKKDIAQI